MPQDHRGQPDRQVPSRRKALGDWQDDWKRITGEVFSVTVWLARVHPDDVARVVCSVIHAHNIGRLDHEYRLRDSEGKYVRVHGQAWRVGNQWIGTLDVLGKNDRPNMHEIIPLTYKN